MTGERSKRTAQTPPGKVAAALERWLTQMVWFPIALGLLCMTTGLVLAHYGRLTLLEIATTTVSGWMGLALGYWNYKDNHE